MAKVFVERARDPSQDPVPMFYICVEGYKYGRVDEAAVTFETKRGFGFAIRQRDAEKLAQLILRELKRGAGQGKRRTR